MIVSLRAFEKVKLYKAFITLLEGAEVERPSRASGGVPEVFETPQDEASLFEDKAIW
jgi:hypothetical protein